MFHPAPEIQGNVCPKEVPQMYADAVKRSLADFPRVIILETAMLLSCFLFSCESPISESSLHCYTC